MALQDLTPQLRTRLSRVERVVGLFVAVATLLLALGLGYYVAQTAKRKGWFLIKTPYFTFVRDAKGLKVGETVKLMGFDVGEIVEITAQPPEDKHYNVYVRFVVREPFYGYLWSDSRARVTAGDFLGNRVLEVTKGSNGAPTYLFHEFGTVTIDRAFELVGTNHLFAQIIYDAGSNVLARPGWPLKRELLQAVAALGSNTLQIAFAARPSKRPTGIWTNTARFYLPFTRETKGFFLLPEESPALTERAEKVVDKIEEALPDFLRLTNKLAVVLSNAASMTRHAEELFAAAKPILTNFGQISANLSGPQGTLGEWLIPTNLNRRLEGTLDSANAALTTANTNVSLITSNLLVNLEHLAGITSNLNAQVQANGFILSGLSDLIEHTDEIVQGLKRHWLLKSAFAPQTNAPPRSIVNPRLGEEK
jgi:hypothetical protein